jgi:hypothetical protein
MMVAAAGAPNRIPILVIGMNRSGTKWLSNILCNHPDVVGVQAERHTGVLETNLLGRMQALVGEIDRAEHYVAFVELWSQTDFFKASGIEKEFLYQQTEKPRSMLEAFQLLMDEVARRAGTAHWLQKCSPIDAALALLAFPNARVVTIQRDLIPTLESSLELSRMRGDSRSFIRAAAVYAYEAKLIAELRQSRAATHVRYEDLRRRPDEEIGRVCSALGLEFRSEMLEVGYRSNTSFETGERETLGPIERRLAALVAGSVKLLPTSVLGALRAPLRSRQAILVPGTYAEIVERNKLG